MMEKVIIDNFSLKNLHMSKKSSNFAGIFNDNYHNTHHIKACEAVVSFPGINICRFIEYD